MLLFSVAEEDHTDADCVAVAILSHGDKNGVISGIDNENIKISRLVAPLKGDNCQTLIGKPKLFFIQV